MADKSTTIISLPQMVDLALNSPEVGIVNFTVLHSLLHVLVNQMDLGDCNVEFRGSDSERLQSYISSAKPGPIITLTEYTVGPDGKERKKKKKKSKRSSATADEKGKKDEHQKEKEIAIIKKEEEGGSLEAESSGSMQTIVVVEPASREKVGESPKFTIAVTKEHLGKLQKDIKDLQRKVGELTDLPGNMGLIEAVKTSKDGGPCSPILDMFQILTLVKRVDATEVAMNKMASMIEDLAKGHTMLASQHQTSGAEGSQNLVAQSQDLRRSLDMTVGGANQVQDMSTQIQEASRKVNALAGQIKDLDERVVSLEKHGTGGIGTSSDHLETKRQRSQTKKKHKSGDLDTDKDQDESEYAMTTEEGGEPSTLDLESTDLTALNVKDAIGIIQKELYNMKTYNLNNDAGVHALKEIENLKKSLIGDEKSAALPPDVKFGQLDIKINDLKDQVTTLDTVYHQQFGNIKDRIDHLEQEISALWERINTGLPDGDASGGGNNQKIQELFNKLVQLQEDMDGLAETANKLLTEREGRETSLDVMIEQIELLKTVKADREDLEDALADKADVCQINRKVSHEQFDAAYDEITRNLENTLDKLRRQEELWLQSLNDLQREIGNKLDKMELTPLKDYINLKIKGLQDRIKKMSALKQEHEAAGTKSKLLRNVNCISCDADVVMKKQTDITMFPKPYAMPANKSPAPYLAYELDLLRKQQKGLPSSKNLNMFESALQIGKLKTTDKDHLCNRYCGGSHTITTPQQRVMRVGHFMEQWGPEIAPVNEVLIKGTDGHYYKGRDDTALRAAALEKAPTPKVDSPPIVVSECKTGWVRASQAEPEAEALIAKGPSATAVEVRASHESGSGMRPKSSSVCEEGKPAEMKRASTRSAEFKPN